MSDDIYKLIGRLRSYVRSPNYITEDIFAAVDTIEALRAERDRLKAALVRLRDCDWVIRLPDRMDGVRQIARKALGDKE